MFLIDSRSLEHDEPCVQKSFEQLFKKVFLAEFQSLGSWHFDVF